MARFHRDSLVRSNLIPRRTILAAGIAVIGAFSLVQCGRTADSTTARPSEPPRRLIVSGASTCIPVLTKLTPDLEQMVPGLELQVEGGGTTRGIRETVSGRNDLGAAARELTLEEEGKVNAYVFAKDGVGIVVNSANSLKSISTAQLTGIYSGTITRWRELGGNDARIVAVGKAEGHATLDVFSAHIGVAKNAMKVGEVAGDNTQVLLAVRANKHAIGYVSLGEAREAMKQMPELRVINLDGVEATPEAVAKGRWPMIRPLILVTRGTPSSDAQHLLDLLASPRGLEAITETGFVPAKR